MPTITAMPPHHTAILQHCLKIKLVFERTCRMVELKPGCELLLGRRTLSQTLTVLDLSDFDAFALGVSRLHAALIYENGQLYVEDRGSSEGTRVGDLLLMPFRRHAVRNGERLRLGQLAFRLEFS